MLADVKWAELGELIWVAPVAGIFVCGAYSLVILGAARAADARRSGAPGIAFAFTALAVVAFVVFLAAVVFGISVITRK